MKKLLVFSILVLSFTAFVNAQGSTPPLVTKPTPLIDSPSDKNLDVDERARNLRLAEAFPVKNEEERRIFTNAIKPLYRESTKEELAAIAPDEELANTYSEFLRDKKTGLTRLVADIGCVTKDDVVKATPECSQYTMPGGGSSFSFRFGDYRLFRLSDLNLHNNKFEALGVLSHGILVNLGDISLADVTLDTDGVDHITGIRPSSNFNDAGAFADKLLSSYKKGKFTYGSNLDAVADNTYVLRSIAYRGVAARRVEGIVYNELELDEREDVVVAFRVVSMNEGKDVTILWKILKSKKSPKLEAPK